MNKTIKFGRQIAQQPPFFINDISFSSLPLSLAEEKSLALAGLATAEDETALMDGLLSVLVDILNARQESKGEPIDVEWLLNNLAAKDLEGIVEHLRQV